MSDTRKLKKSESLEIRLPHPTKQAFMARCHDEGRSASEAIRAFIDAELTPPRRPWGRLRYLFLGGLAMVTLGAVAAPSLARPTAQVSLLDGDRDGAVSISEFQSLDLDRDGRVSLAELTRGLGRTDLP